MIEATYHTKTASETSVTVGELANMLKQKGVQTSRDELYKWLRENGYLRCGKGYNMPTEAAVDSGLFELDEKTDIYDDGHTVTIIITKVTAKGQQHFINKFAKGIKPLPKRDPGSAFIPPEGKFTIVPPPKKRIMQVVILTVLPLIKAVSAHCVDDEGDNGVTVIMPMAEARAKDIRLGDIVEVADKKILRVLLEKRGDDNAKDEKG